MSLSEWYLGLILMLAALLPSAVLLVQVYRLDSIEKEPKRLLLGLAGAGALAGAAACGLEIGLLYLLRTLMPGRSLVRMLIENFIIVGLLEESCKYLPVRWLAWRNPAFNYQFDAASCARGRSCCRGWSCWRWALRRWRMCSMSGSTAF